MNIKKAAYEDVAELLRRQHNAILFKINDNKRQMQAVRQRQTVLKRERAIVTSLIRELGADFDKDQRYLKPRAFVKGKR